jgi:NAD(P)H-hydrate epimerase
MLDCISVENMRRSDAYTIANFVPSLELMHRAAYGVFLAADWQGSTAIVVGSGNNGGDGFALACILKEKGCDCTVFTVSRKLSGDSAYYAEKAKALNVNIKPFSAGCLAGFPRIVDCLLGTGFQGLVREPYRTAVQQINASDAYIISVDINSGMNGDTGEAELAVRSDLTVTIGYIKTGLVAENAGEYMKKLVCADIGIRLQQEEYKILCPGDTPEGERLYIRHPHWLDLNTIKSY